MKFIFSCILISLLPGLSAEASSTPGIDDDAIISVEQAGSIASSKGAYGWDSRGAHFYYTSRDGSLKGDLGEILFCNQNGERKNFIWDSWGMKFPDWWTRMLAERIRAGASDNLIPAIRHAFEEAVEFECDWIIAIGIKSEKAGGKLYKTLREDNTLRVAYNVDLNKEGVPERLFRGEEMYSSLSYILKNEVWGTDSQRTFTERNPYIYSVRINSYDINLSATNCRICAEKGLPTGTANCSHVPEGTFFNDRIPICYNGISYSGGKSFAWEGQSVTYDIPEYEGYKRSIHQDFISGINESDEKGTIKPASDYRQIFVFQKENDGTPDVPDEPWPDEPGKEPEPEDNPKVPEVGVNENASVSEISTTDSGFTARFVSDIFDVSTAIPSTESVYIKAYANRYLMKISTSNVSGVWPVNVVLEFPYELSWTEQDNVNDENNDDENYDGENNDEENIAELLHTKSGSIVRTATVYRPYSYNHLISFNYSVLDSVSLCNSALNPTNITLTPDMVGVTMRQCSLPVVHGGTIPGDSGNIRLPANYSSRIVLPITYVYGEGTEPEPPSIDDDYVRNLAEGAVGQMECRDDELIFDSRNLLGDSDWHSGNRSAAQVEIPKTDRIAFDTRSIWGPDAIYIPAGMRNGRYISPAANVYYRTIVNYGGSMINSKSTAEVNDIFVHTPVLCRIEIDECNPQMPNSSFYQGCEKPQEAYFELVSGSSDSPGCERHENDSCDFYINVSNKGNHSIYSSTLGTNYDFRKNQNGKNGGSYVMLNEVKFPFDVYADVGDDRDRTNDILLAADVWHPISVKTRLYVPDYVSEGEYTVEARSRAVNSVSRSDYSFVSIKYGKPYMRFNSRTEDYVAADAVNFHISGKVYGLKLVDIDSEAEWKNVFNKEVINTEDGTQLKNLPEGRAKESELDRYFFYYTVGTNNELGLPAGRNGRFVLPLLNGSSPNMRTRNVGILKPGYVWTYELQTSGSRMNEPGAYIDVDVGFSYVPKDKWERKQIDVYYSESINKVRHGYIKIGGEADSENVHYKYDSSGEAIAYYTYKHIRVNQPISGKGDPDNKLVWEFDYSLPETIVVKDGNQIKKDGYLIISFSITAFDGGDNPVTVYQSATGYCNMWAMEGSSLFRTDYYGKQFTLNYGDVSVVDLANLKRNDYRIDHRY